MKAKKTYKGKADILNISTFYRLVRIPMPMETYGRCKGTKEQFLTEYCDSLGRDTELGNGYCLRCWDKVLGTVDGQSNTALPT